MRHYPLLPGTYFRLSAPLAKLEAGIAIVKRFPKLELAPGPLKWRPFLGTRGLRELRLLTG